MAIKKKKTGKRRPSPEPAYLTKRILSSAARAGVAEAAKETMQVMGYNVIAQNGWIVKIFEDGTTEKISKLETEEIPKNFVLR